MIPSAVPITPAKISAEDQPRQHVAAELVGAEQVSGAAPGLPDRRFETRGETADFGIVRRQHIGKDRDEGDAKEDQSRDQRKIAEPR